MSIRISQFRNGGWEVDIRVQRPDGSRIRERVLAPVSARSAATRWAEQRAAFLILQGKSDPVKPKEIPTLKAFSERFIVEYAEAEQQKPSGIDSKRLHLRAHLVPALGDRRLNEIDDEAIAQLKSSLKSRSRKTVNNILSTLSKLLKVAQDWGLLEKLPCRIRMFKYESPEMGFYGFGEYGALVDAAEKIDLRILGMVLLGGDAGLRRGEIVAFEGTDVDYRRGVIKVMRSDWRGEATLPKAGRRREVPMTERLRATLRALQHLRGPRLLYTDDGLPARKEVLYDWMKAAQRRAGLPVSPGLHALRHTFCSHLAMQGAPARAIQELAGHAKLTTTMKYMHLSPGATGTAIRLLDHRPTETPGGDQGETTLPGKTNGVNSVTY
jgi:integrase